MSVERLDCSELARLSVIDSHTGGMPTRVIVDGFPPLRGATLAERRDDLAKRYKRLRDAVVGEPRGNEPMVAALLTAPDSDAAATGVIYFDRAEVLRMCGHGTIGVAHTLRALGRIGEGGHLLDTPAGSVEVCCLADGRIRLANVHSRRLASGVRLQVPDVGPVTADVAYGGNNFLVVSAPAIPLHQPLDALLATTRKIMAAAQAEGLDVDHLELHAPPTRADADARNFVLCPSGAYDRSPCGTGSSAKLACLAADGKLAPGEHWVQESITGSVFTLSYQWVDRAAGLIAPVVIGEAELTATGDLLLPSAQLAPDQGPGEDPRSPAARVCDKK